MREALLFHRQPDKGVLCLQCAHRCEIHRHQRGQCGVMCNVDGVLYSLAADRLSVSQVDAIERKWFYHVLPGSKTLAVAAMGCNLNCVYCQTHEISQVGPDTKIKGFYARPEEVVAYAESFDCSSIVFTYTEPGVHTDLVLDVSRNAKDAGLLSLIKTNGFLTEDAVIALAPHIGGANIDLKCFSDAGYQDVCGGKLKPVLETIESMVSRRVWVELTTVLVPGLTDTRRELERIARYIVSIDRRIPWHIVACEPDYHAKHFSRISRETLRMAVDIGREHEIAFVYAPELQGEDGVETTFCPNCCNMLIDRFQFQARWCRMNEGLCPDCKKPVPGIWTEPKINTAARPT